MNMVTYPLKQKSEDETGTNLGNIKCLSPTKHNNTIFNCIEHDILPVMSNHFTHSP